ncbi:glycosyltransferase family 2 protein [Nesterenkonia sphaerica]|uniref:Glycosyltransferase n=1 Tax=Nesterenkonia sphaerica TaxID=1804988 RepID=A0A5R9A9W4_9MICC|nr:glycosyltransferase family 2 protein [Nesterenkonia sphaerica]TLP75569.1 glycosyltransferase [Nesterenkonia sphaerica]
MSSLTAENEALLRARLMRLYLDNAMTVDFALERTALRSESVQMRELLAFAASHGTLDFDQLSTKLLGGGVTGISLNAPALGRLAYVTALQDLRPDDTAIACKALEIALASGAGNEAPRLEKLLAELYFEQGMYTELDQLLSQRPSVRRPFHSYLSVDARNPYVRPGLRTAAWKRWLREFNWQFTRRDLRPVTLRDGDDVPFNRLTAAPELAPQPQGPLVSVIMTCFKPLREDAVQAARSILDQTWARLELLVVDDASPAGYAPVLEEIAELDRRVRVIRLETNSGTYAARNVGIAYARGEFLTGQDSDDWSHPQRLQTQVNDLLRNPRRPANQVYTVNMTEDLVRIRRGYSPFIPSAPTLMVRASIMRELGGYIPARKAADNEMRDRISAYTGHAVYAIPEPLIFMRIQPDSLSRADFRAGWQHPARRAFWSSYRTWHSAASKPQLRQTAEKPHPIYVPPRFTAAPGSVLEARPLDVVFAADWCEHGETQAAALAEIRDLVDHGCRVGVMHLENAIHLSRYARTYTQPVQALISAGEVTHVMADEPFHNVTLMLVCAPELVQFLPSRAVSFTVKHSAVVAGKPPVDGCDFTVRYLPALCSAQAREFFGVRPRWIPGDPTTRAQLNQLLSPGELTTQDYTASFDPDLWPGPRRRPNMGPVIGRWAGETAWQWPGTTDDFARIWPTDGSADVRFYGDTATLLNLMGQEKLPAAWLSFQPGDIDRRTYYRSLDFFVHYPQPRAGVQCELPVLEALASGCVAVLPPWLEPVYGTAAVYAEAGAVQQTLTGYSRSPEAFRRQSHRGVEFATLCRSRGFRDLIDAVVAGGHVITEEEKLP